MLSVAVDLRVEAKGRLNLRVTKSTTCSCVLVPSCWVNLWFKVGVSGTEWIQFVVGAQDWPENYWQILVESDHLVLGNVDTASLLEEVLIVPGWMNAA